MDNEHSDKTHGMVEEFSAKLTAQWGTTVADLSGNENRVVYAPQTDNLGGAGGFSAGVKKAYELGAEWFWVMDDDVAVMPCAGQIQVSVSDDAGDVVAAAHGDRIGSGFATGPSGQTEGDRENGVLGGVGSRTGCAKAHRDGSLAGPGHIGHDVKAHIGAGKPGMDAAAHIQMHIQGG